MDGKILNTVSLVVALMLAACSSDNLTETSDMFRENRLVVSYSVDGGQPFVTRAEAGTEDENRIYRLDLFIVTDNGWLHSVNTNPAKAPTSWEVADISGVEVPENGTYYLVANCQSLADVQTIDQLRAGTAKNLSCDVLPEDGFVMDAKGEFSKNGNDVTLTFSLKRAVAKIRIGFNGNNTDFDEVEYRMFNYATTTSVLDESETYNNPLTSESGLKPVSELGTIKDKTFSLYSYANDWFDNEKCKISGDDYTIKGLNGKETQPIITEKQTYVLIKAQYNNIEGYYKIPVNYQLPKFNDEKDETFTKDEYDKIRDLYRMHRNYIYDVTVTIDRPGGPITDPIIPEYSVGINDWVSGGDYQLPPDDFQENKED